MTGEKVAAARERVVARGALPNWRISPGYVRGADGVLVVERAKARIVVQAFKRRDRGASLVEIQALLAENGIERSISGVESMLRSRMYLGEIHFGELHNLNAHETPSACWTSHSMVRRARGCANPRSATPSRAVVSPHAMSAASSRAAGSIRLRPGSTS